MKSEQTEFERITKAHEEVEKQLAEVRKAQLEKEAEYWVYAPVQLHVHASPFSLMTHEDPTSVAQGESVTLPVLVRREFGFQGPVHLKTTIPESAGLLVAEAVIGAGQQFGRLTVRAGNTAKLGDRDVIVRGVSNFNGVEVTHNATFRIQVTSK